VNNLGGIRWDGVDLAEISAGPNSPQSKSNKDQEHVLMLMRFERMNRTGRPNQRQTKPVFQIRSNQFNNVKSSFTLKKVMNC
jgi:hypothetical protein